MSVDGFIAGPNGEMDWMTLPWSNDVNAYVSELTAPVDGIVLGRKLAQGFIPYWSGVAEDSSNPEQDSGKMFTETPKVVFTKTLDSCDWKNTRLASGDLKQEIEAMKAAPGGDIIAYGGAEFVSSLIREQLIDELHLFINPVILGNGMSIFQQSTERQNLKLLHSRQFDCGISVLAYERA